MKKSALLFIVLIVFSYGCGSKSNMESFVREDIDLGYISRIAIVPFENNSSDKFAAERIRDMAITQTLAYGLFDVVDKGVVDSALREEAIDLNKESLNNTDIKRLGQILKVEAFMLGTIDQAGQVQRGSVSYPELALTLRLVDIHSGMIIWQASGNKSGESYGKRLFGIAADDEFKVALKLLRQLLQTITAVSQPQQAVESDASPAVESTDESGLEIIEEVPQPAEEEIEIVPEQG